MLAHALIPALGKHIPLTEVREEETGNDMVGREKSVIREKTKNRSSAHLGLRIW